MIGFKLFARHTQQCTSSVFSRKCFYLDSELKTNIPIILLLIFQKESPCPCSDFLARNPATTRLFFLERLRFRSLADRFSTQTSCNCLPRYRRLATARLSALEGLKFCSRSRRFFIQTTYIFFLLPLLLKSRLLSLCRKYVYAPFFSLLTAALATFLLLFSFFLRIPFLQPSKHYLTLNMHRPS